MTVQLIDIKEIIPNPYQPRQVMDEATIRELAESIHEHGLLQPPHARAVDGRYQLAFGHRRLAAWKIAKPGEPFPCEVVEVTDRQMFDRAIAENDDREPLNPVERARAIQRYIDEFKVTQLEAGKRFKLTTQGAVSNVLRLLELPLPIQKRLGEGVIVERAARELLPLIKLDERKAIAIVEKSAAQPEGDRSEWIAQEIDDFLAQDARPLREMPWPVDWPKESIRWAASPAGLEDLPRCKGCPSNITRGRESYCVRPACYQAKLNSFSGLEVNRVSKLTGIARATPLDKTTRLYPSGKKYDWEARRNAQKLIATKAAHPHLRLVLCADGDDSAGQHQAFGSSVVGLVTVNLAATNRLLVGEKPRPADGKASKPPTPAEVAKQKAKEQAGQDKRRKARCEFLRAKHDVLWLIGSAACIIGKQFVISGGVLNLAEETICGRYRVLASIWPEFGEMEDAIIKAIKKDGAEEDRRIHIALSVIGEDIFDYHKPEQAYDWPNAQGKVKKIVFETFRVKLPLKWNEPPIHHTEYNCWHCGIFASSEKLTKRDQAEGWAVTMKDKAVADVRCPDCATDKPTPAKKGKKK